MGSIFSGEALNLYLTYTIHPTIISSNSNKMKFSLITLAAAVPALAAAVPASIETTEGILSVGYKPEAFQY